MYKLNTIISVLLLSLLLNGCGAARNAKYAAYEKVGVHKRDLFVDSIEDTSKAQAETKEQFQSAYEELATLVDIDDQGLEKKYKRIASAVEDSEAAGQELESRISSVERVAKDLFAEWERELEDYQNETFKRSSAEQLRVAQARYVQINNKMRYSQQSVGPVLRVLQDNSLYLKHNLNARAISSISSEVVVIQSQVAELIEQMEA